MSQILLDRRHASTVDASLVAQLTIDAPAASVPFVEVRTLAWWLAVSGAAYAAAALSLSWAIVPALRSRMDSGAIDGFLSLFVRLLLRGVHHATWSGWEQLPNEWRTVAHSGPSRGLIVVSNHASGIDPFVLQMPLRKRIRWMMATDQMVPAFADLWRHLAVLPVSYGPNDAATFREAVRHVQAGGALGIFPEGGIARPPRELRPFLAGVGMLVARSKAPVLLCWIDGAPTASSAFTSLFKPSRTTVRCVGLVDFGSERDSRAILERLRQMLLDASGWPANDEPLPSARADSQQTADRGAPVASKL